MKIKNKGKVYPSPSSSSSSSSSFPASGYASSSRDATDDFLSVLKLLPATILTLASVLSLQDREVLAYMITRSLQTTTTSTATANYSNPKQSSLQDSKKKTSPSKTKPPNTNANSNNHNHKAPLFDCDCFDCYTSYWFRWDSSPNRELIHQVIEAFEEHLAKSELLKKNNKGKKRDKTSRRAGDKTGSDHLGRPEMRETTVVSTPDSSTAVSPNDDVLPVVIPERAADGEEVEGNVEVAQLVTSVAAAAAAETDEVTVAVGLKSPLPAAAVNNHKGLARKVLPDVLGLFNSRLWNLWSPNV